MTKHLSQRQQGEKNAGLTYVYVFVFHDVLFVTLDFEVKCNTLSDLFSGVANLMAHRCTLQHVEILSWSTWGVRMLV